MSECKTCGQSFKKRQTNQLYCSKGCKLEGLKVEKSCESCGETFKTRHNSRFCSNKCRAVNSKKKSTVTLKCTCCGKSFERIKSAIKGSKIGSFCRKECLLEYSSKTKGKSHYKSNGKNVSCACCGKSFYRQTHAIRNSNFCSSECYFKHIHNDTLTDEERMENRDYKEYREWRKEVYERDDYTCQCCGERGQKLAAHHIFNFAKYKELRTDLNNGITLCQPCHKEFHFEFGIKDNNDHQLKEFIDKKKAIPSQAG